MKLKSGWWLVLALALCLGCDIFTVAQDVDINQQQNQEAPCGTCPDGTTATAIEACECRPVVRNGVASSCIAEWTAEGPTVCDWSATRASDGLTDSGRIQRGGEIDPGPPGQGAGFWALEICGCVAGFNADS